MGGEVTLGSVCAPSDDVVARVIEGEVVLVPLVAGVGDADDELFTLNDSARAIWGRLDGKRTLGEVAGLVAEEFDVPRAQLEADVLGFAAELVRRRILTVAG